MSIWTGENSNLWSSSTCPNVLPRCNHCEQPIRDPKDATFALGTVFHKEHFNCIECLEPLKGSNFRRVDGEVYCEDDYHRLFSIKCAFCVEPIRHDGMMVMGRPYHRKSCFKCFACSKVLKETNYYPVNGRVYCKEDWKRYFAPRCIGCKKPISRALAGGSIAASGNKAIEYHPECYFIWNP